MAKTTNNKKLFRKYLDKVKTLNKDKNIDDIYLSILKGKNSYLRYHRYESSLFDSSWIDVIEDVLLDLGDIVANPRQVIKRESNIVPVELAKKIDGESVMHLASHTQYIKEIDEDGNVIPSKILSHSNEDNMITYENRFIATFIRRLVVFIEARYQYIQSLIPFRTEDVLMFKNSSTVNGQEVEIETKIKITKESNDNLAVTNNNYIERILKMREYVFYYYNSPFMRKLKNERDVRKPILQTNIIRKNHKYNKCFKAFMFIERFDSLGVSYKVNETYHDFDDTQIADLNYLLLSNYLSIQSEDEYEEIKQNVKTYKPKIKTSIDEESFVFGPPLTGTLEFVRVDEEYRNYLNSLGQIDLPLHPNKYEKLYYKGEYQLRKENKKELQEIEKILRRKVRENENWEKYVQNVLERVAIEDREEERRRLEAIIKDEQDKIEKKRQELIAAAKADQKDVKAQEKIDRQIAKEKKKEADAIKKAEEEKKKQAEKEKVKEEPILPIEEEKPTPTPAPIMEEVIPSEPVNEVAPVEEAPVSEPAPEVEVPTIEEIPVEQNEEPVTTSEENSPIVEEEILEAPHSEEPVQEEPVIEEPTLEEQPREVEEPVNEPVQEEPVIEEPKPEKEVRMIYARQVIVVDENGTRHVKIITSDAKSPNSSSKMKSEKTGENKTKKESKPDKKPNNNRYVVKALNGFYVDEHKYSKNIEDAKVFDSFEKANEIRKRLGGTVIKL